MIVWVEGPDGVGKSTFARMLKDEGFEVIHFPLTYDSITNDHVKTMLNVLEEFKVARELVEGLERLVFDRSPFSTLVYNALSLVNDLKVATLMTLTHFDALRGLEPDVVLLFLGDKDDTITRRYTRLYEEWGDVVDILARLSSKWEETVVTKVKPFDFSSAREELLKVRT